MNKLRPPRNVLGGELETCSSDPLTGFYRSGCCDAGAEDTGFHTVCIEATSEFLAFSQSRGNDLSTPNLAYGFPGLRPGAQWCLCALRWQEAFEAGYAPQVRLRASHEASLEFISLADLMMYALDADDEFGSSST